ncbi:hypothetical protein ACCO45_001750 [Purpureocillium lilacinum]|uniref:Uncharacterized protein n=1 Tax=Purpureocillium lilacinum TaxID=33203 RepID=A0ACC4E8F4_PURLI
MTAHADGAVLRRNPSRRLPYKVAGPWVPPLGVEPGPPQRNPRPHRSHHHDRVTSSSTQQALGHNRICGHMRCNTNTPHQSRNRDGSALAKALRPAHRSTGLSRASLQLRASRSITMSRAARWQTRKALVVNCSGNCYSTACHVPARGTGGELPRRGIRTFPWPISQKRSALLYVTTLTLRDVRPADQDGDATWKPDGWLASSNTATRR